MSQELAKIENCRLFLVQIIREKARIISLFFITSSGQYVRTLSTYVL
jgi:hypothetical protein